MSEWIEYDGRLKAVVKYGLKQVYSDKKQGRDLDLQVTFCHEISFVNVGILINLLCFIFYL